MGLRGNERFAMDAKSVEGYRDDLRAMGDGMPLVEEAVEGLTDWQVLQAMESLWAAAKGDDDQPQSLSADESSIARN